MLLRLSKQYKGLGRRARWLSSSIAASRNSDGSLTAIGAAIEAEQCLLCVDAPCATACPAGTRPDKFIRQLRFGNALGAAETILDNNALGGICGTVCPVSRLCEGACTRNNIDGPVKIGRIQRYLHDLGLQENIELPPLASRTGHKAAVIGSGILRMPLPFSDTPILMKGYCIWQVLLGCRPPVSWLAEVRT